MLKYVGTGIADCFAVNTKKHLQTRVLFFTTNSHNMPDEVIVLHTAVTSKVAYIEAKNNFTGV